LASSSLGSERPLRSAADSVTTRPLTVRLRRCIAASSRRTRAQGVLLDDAEIGRIAATHGKTTAQVTLRWHIQRGHIIFPKSMHRERMQENLEIFDFELSAEEMATLDGLDKGEPGRTGPNPDTMTPRL
jgi:diketogulonate reductase-like aldo/keto reductase